MWRQPIPTKIPELIGQKFKTSVFQHLLLRAANDNTSVYINGAYIPLKRGQCVIGRFEFAEEFGMKRSESMRVQRMIDKLEKTDKLVSKRKSRDCTIITILNYDMWVQFEQTDEQTVSKRRANREQTVSTNKSVKNIETIKSVKNTEDLQEIINHYNSTFKKNVTSTESFKKNYEHWSSIHPIGKIKQAITFARDDSFWRNKMTLQILFRRKDRQGEDVDNIENLSNRGPLIPTLSDNNLTLAYTSA